QLEAARDAHPDPIVDGVAGDVLAVEDEGAAVGREEAADQVHQRRLPRAVRSDEPEELALADRQRDVVDGEVASERLRDVADLQKTHARALPRSRAISWPAVPTRPVGMASTRATRMTPTTSCQ